MTVPQLEKRVLDYLTTKGAATKFEIKAAIGCSKSGVQLAVKKLVASGRVETTPRLRKHNSARSHAVYSVVVAKPIAPVFKQPAVESVNVFEHPEIYNRLRELEEHTRRLDKIVTNLREDLTDATAGLKNELGALAKDYTVNNTRLNKAVKYINDLDLNRIRIDGVLQEDRWRMDDIAERLRALEPQPAVDPLYTEIEQDITDKLGGQISPELLRATIDNAYAERKK
jgi:hypothetical protein